MRPTILLIHGAFAESSSWNGVAESLLGADYDVVAAANPLRGLSADAESVSDVVRSIEGPVVLVAHSYDGAVMTNVDAGASEIIGLVYVNGFAPEHGESCFGLAAMYPGSMLGEETARPVPRSDGTTDLYVAPGRFHDMFCQDVLATRAALMATTQRPATQEALVEPSGERPLWKDVPSWFLIGDEDRIIPSALQHFMADRVGSRRKLCSQANVRFTTPAHAAESQAVVGAAADDHRIHASAPQLATVLVRVNSRDRRSQRRTATSWPSARATDVWRRPAPSSGSPWPPRKGRRPAPSAVTPRKRAQSPGKRGRRTHGPNPGGSLQTG
jgi:pimeloyl-ACP methyl ester carboxylesterase